MRLIIRPTYEDVSKWAANHVAQKIKEFSPTKKSHLSLDFQQEALQSVCTRI